MIVCFFGLFSFDNTTFFLCGGPNGVEGRFVLGNVVDEKIWLMMVLNRDGLITYL